MEKPLSRRERKALVAHRALLDAGLSAFDRRPIGMVSVLDITEVADVAKGVFYLHFKSKDEFLIALWEDVRSGLLEMIRLNMEGAQSQPSRLQRTIDAYFLMAEQRPQSARFWIRMSGFFADEIGQPGQLTRVREEYLEQLAGLVANVSYKKVTKSQRKIAYLLDACCAGVIAQMMRLDSDWPIDRSVLRKVIQSAIFSIND